MGYKPAINHERSINQAEVINAWAGEITQEHSKPKMEHSLAKQELYL